MSSAYIPAPKTFVKKTEIVNDLTSGGTTVPLSAEQGKVLKGMVDAINPGGFSANAFYRGKNLGTITSSNIASFVTSHGLATGAYTDIYPGDYFTIQDGTYNVEWMVAGCGIQHNKGDTANAHGIEVIPRAQGFAYGTQMNSSNTTAGGYKGSAMFTFLRDTVAPKLSAVLGSHLLDQQCLLSKTVDTSKASQQSTWTGISSDWEWTSVKCVLMSEPQVYGGPVFGGPFDVGEANQQLPVFRFISPVEFGRGYFWLRAVASSTYFALCGSLGNANYSGASNTWICVRPLIRIG